MLLLVGSATPMVEFYRGFYNIYNAKRVNLVKDEIRTLNKEVVIMPYFRWPANHQFAAKKYRTDIFWKFIAKRQKGLNM